MNLADILKIVNLLPTIINVVQQIKGAGNGTEKKETVRDAVLASAGVMETLNKLTVLDRKKFDKELNKAIDGIVGMLKVSEWKKGGLQ